MKIVSMIYDPARAATRFVVEIDEWSLEKDGRGAAIDAMDRMVRERARQMVESKWRAVNRRGVRAWSGVFK